MKAILSKRLCSVGQVLALALVLGGCATGAADGGEERWTAGIER